MSKEEISFFERITGKDADTLEHQQAKTDGLPSPESLDEQLMKQKKDLAELTEKDTWENNGYVVRVESLNEGNIWISYRTESTKKDLEGKGHIFTSIQELKDFLGNDGYTLKFRRMAQRAVIGDTEEDVDGKQSAHVIDIATLRQKHETKQSLEASKNQKFGTIEIDEEGLREIEKLANEALGLIERAKVTVNNEALTEEQKKGKESLIWEKENQLGVIEYLVNNEKTNKQEALDNLNSLKQWLEVFLVDNETSKESEEEIIDSPQAALVSPSPGENVPLAVEKEQLSETIAEDKPGEDRQDQAAEIDTTMRAPEKIPSSETKQPKESKEQVFDRDFSAAFEDVKAKILDAKTFSVLKSLKDRRKEAEYRFFNLDDFAKYLNSVRDADERKEVFDRIRVAERELDILYRSRAEQLEKSSEERSLAKKKKESVSSTVAPEQEVAPEERTYEDLEGALGKIYQKQCISVVSESLAPLMRFSQKENRPLRDLVEELGIENLIQAVLPALGKILPLEWKDEDRERFAVQFAEREIGESLE